MKNKNDGGPAFPTDFAWEDGMSLRDYFAAKAMQAIIHDYFNIDFENRLLKDVQNDSVAQAAYRIADAMLKARKG